MAGVFSLAAPVTANAQEKNAEETATTANETEPATDGEKTESSETAAEDATETDGAESATDEGGEDADLPSLPEGANQGTADNAELEDAEPSPEMVEPGSLSHDEIERIKSQIRQEISAELKQEFRSDLEAAARDAANQRAASVEWEEERWVEEIKPKLNFLEFDGYFRSRFDWNYRYDLGTYDPILNRGTSGVPPPTMYRPFDGEPGCGEEPNPTEPDEFPGQLCQAEVEDTQTTRSLNMRLRLDPTLNVSEDIRVRMTLDIFDNLVMGSTPESKPGFVNNPTLPLPLFASSQSPMQAGLNSVSDAIRVKRAWAEVMTPFGQLRFGRQPQNWGLGLLVNDGNGLDDDYGDSADSILFATRVAGHYIVPAYSISSSGPNGRGGGAGLGGDQGLQYFPNEQGQRINLDPIDDVHTFILTVAKKDKSADLDAHLKNSKWPAVNYGVFGVYRMQQYDIPLWYNSLDPSTPATQDQYVRRNANAGVASGWFLFRYHKFKFEAEAVGIVAHIEKTATLVQGDINAVDDGLTTVDGEQPLWILQGGAAFESSYSFLNESLVVGIDGGIASGDDAPGFGLRSVLNQQPTHGDFDGKQYGECLEYNADGDCTVVDNNITNYKFDPDYQVDLILFREIMGTVTDAAYIKPHIAYYLTENIGARADLVYSHAIYASSTPGQQNPMGVEIDGKGFYGSDDGLFVMLQGGFLLPLGAFNHARDNNNDQIGKNFQSDTTLPEQRVNERFLNAQFAWTLQAYAGVQF
jgi:uncharacterized protein (TIGR04551 family)